MAPPAPSRSSSRSSSRWCPSPEQVMILEELYKRGVRTPNASQIQKITAHLSYYGNIQGKNVFYWFQNHKARDRQKLRNKLKLVIPPKLQQQQQQNYLLMYPPPLHDHLHDHDHDHQTQTQTHFFPFHAHYYLSNSNYLPPPPPPPHQYLLPSHHHHSQGTSGAREPETQRMVMKQNCRSSADLPKDFSTETYGHDFMMMMFMEAGPSSAGCRSRPLETLDLFPLTSQPKDQTTSS